MKNFIRKFKSWSLPTKLGLFLGLIGLVLWGGNLQVRSGDNNIDIDFVDNKGALNPTTNIEVTQI